MTGGSDKSKIINQALGRIANEENILHLPLVPQAF